MSRRQDLAYQEVLDPVGDDERLAPLGPRIAEESSGVVEAVEPANLEGLHTGP